jgi:hypothetical protein
MQKIVIKWKQAENASIVTGKRTNNTKLSNNVTLRSMSIELEVGTLTQNNCMV